MIINVREWPKLPDYGRSERERRYQVFVDGRRIQGVWYVDTEAGIVKTLHFLYDADDELIEKCQRLMPFPVFRNSTHSARSFPLSELPQHWEIDAPPNDLISRTLRGRVEVL